MIAVLDIGKTNKKCFVLDEDYQFVFEKSTTLPESTDDDGFHCDDVHLLRQWVLDSLAEVCGKLPVRAFNCTAYGASFVHLGSDGNPVAPLYNYLKPFPADLLRQFFATFGSQEDMALATASPVLGHLNSGLQLYWLKHRKPLIFSQIKRSMHLPEWMADCGMRALAELGIPAVASGPQLPITSLGCHTMLWDFAKKAYHPWTEAEGVAEKLAPETGTGQPSNFGLHDSSAALIPYLVSFKEPFLLISTGTWCISLNPFNQEPLTAEELAQDCLCYISYTGSPVKAARYFGGHEHEQAVRRLAAEFDVGEDFYRREGLRSTHPQLWERYEAFMAQLAENQAASARLALGRSAVRRIFVDGGFSKNDTYMRLLAKAFPTMEVFAAEVAQATAMGAAVAIHEHWNARPLPKDLITLRAYSGC